jgi:type IV secretory pathway VirD2 relaxase
MATDDDIPIFRPKFGKARKSATGSTTGTFRRALLANVRAARQLGRALGRARARVAVRPPTPLSRRVVVKARVVRMTRSNVRSAALHLRYIQRDGVERDGSKGVLYGPDGPVKAAAIEHPIDQEKHQFRFIVSPEDSAELDLTSFVRRWMAQVEKDLGRRLDWAAVNHHNTDNPHAHVVVRGIDLDGRAVRFDREYISNGMRARAQELATLDLGPRSPAEVARARIREVAQNRFTSLDRQLERMAVDGVVIPRARPPRDAALLTARLERLERLHLAECVSPDAWRLVPDWSGQLRELGTRGDIIKQMHAVLHGDPARYRVLDPAAPSAQRLSGRVACKGLADELRGSFFAVVEAPDGAGYRVALSARAAEKLRVGDLVEVSATSDAGSKGGPPRVMVRSVAVPLDRQPTHPGPTWLDQVDEGSLAPYGFGASLRPHLAARKDYLRQRGIDPHNQHRHAALAELARRNIASTPGRDVGPRR